MSSARTDRAAGDALSLPTLGCSPGYGMLCPQRCAPQSPTGGTRDAQCEGMHVILGKTRSHVAVQPGWARPISTGREDGLLRCTGIPGVLPGSSSQRAVSRGAAPLLFTTFPFSLCPRGNKSPPTNLTQTSWFGTQTKGLLMASLPVPTAAQLSHATMRLDPDLGLLFWVSNSQPCLHVPYRASSLGSLGPQHTHVLHPKRLSQLLCWMQTRVHLPLLLDDAG